MVFYLKDNFNITYKHLLQLFTSFYSSHVSTPNTVQFLTTGNSYSRRDMQLPRYF